MCDDEDKERESRLTLALEEFAHLQLALLCLEGLLLKDLFVVLWQREGRERKSEVRVSSSERDETKKETRGRTSEGRTVEAMR